jgi:ATP-dependent DNA helicase RecQ
MWATVAVNQVEAAGSIAGSGGDMIARLGAISACYDLSHVSDPLLPILERYWGYTTFRPLQRDAMEAVLAGRDSLVVLPTGGGKSLCFQVPALAREGLAIVVSPLIALMKDQVDTLVGNGVPAACLHSGLSDGARSDVLGGIANGRYRLLYVAPERLIGEGRHALFSRIGSQRVQFVAVDEAHCISQWGHDFRPEYRKLAELRQRWPSIGFHAFTATATARVRRDIVSQLGLRNAVELVGSFDRPNLVYRVLARSNLRRQIQEILARHPREAGIIYCQSRREVDELAAWLDGHGVRVRPYHAGMTDEDRHRNQDAFLNEDIDVVVATVAFGMGIDRSDVRFVIHAGAPQSLEHYQQEAGRAGRDGLEAECVLIYSGGDFARWRMMFDQAGDAEARRTLLRDMERYASSVDCRHRRLVAYFGETIAGESCGACDYCLGELEPVPDAVTVARKILSAVARVGQRFGAAHVVNVLRGRETDAVVVRGHKSLSVFGLLADHAADQVRGYVDQLLAGGWLRQSEGDYPVLQLTPEGIALMKDPGAVPDFPLARQRKPEKGRTPRDRQAAASWEGVDRDLFESLRVLRLHLARARAVPPYVIFHDTTLRELARVRPGSVEMLRHVYGVGQRKAEDYGAAILEVIREHQPAAG